MRVSGNPWHQRDFSEIVFWFPRWAQDLQHAGVTMSLYASLGKVAITPCLDLAPFGQLQQNFMRCCCYRHH